MRVLDRIVKQILPQPIAEFTPAPRQVADNLWVAVRKLRMPPALRLPTNMTLLRLANGGVVVHSPVHPDPDLLAATNALGPVVAIVAPNSFHYSYVAEWVKQYPSATFFCAPGLPARVPGLPPATALRDTPPALWTGDIDQIVYGPVGPFSEVAFLHRPSRTLILCDLAFNLFDYDSPAQRIAWRLMGVQPSFGPSRTARMTLLRDRDAARPYLRRMAQWKFERVIVAHGEVIERNGLELFQHGFAAYL